MTGLFDNPRYGALEAERLGGALVSLDVGGGAPVMVVRRETSPGSGEFDAVSVYGYPRFPRAGSEADLAAGLAALQAAGRDAGLLTIYLRLQPDVAAPAAPCVGVAGVAVGRVVAVDLTVPWSEILGGYRAQLRYDVRKFQGLYATERSAAKSAEFAALYAANMDRVNAAAAYYFTPDYFAALADMDGVTYWFLRTDTGDLAAAALIVEDGDTVYYHLGASDPDHARRASMKVLLSRVLEHHAQGGANHLVLGGGLGGRDDSLYRFKRGFSSLELPVYAARVICDLDRYRLLTGSDDPSTGFFPAYRAG